MPILSCNAVMGLLGLPSGQITMVNVHLQTGVFIPREDTRAHGVVIWASIYFFVHPLPTHPAP